MSPTNRRDLIKGAVLLPIAAQVRTQPARQAGGTRPVVIASANGIRAVAKAHGFPEENLLTERSRKIWLYWKEKLSGHDDWIEAGNEEEKDPDIRWFIEKFGSSDFRPQGTINCDAVTAGGDIVGTTTTSG